MYFFYVFLWRPIKSICLVMWHVRLKKAVSKIKMWRKNKMHQTHQLNRLVNFIYLISFFFFLIFESHSEVQYKICNIIYLFKSWFLFRRIILQFYWIDNDSNILFFYFLTKWYARDFDNSFTFLLNNIFTIISI